MRTLLALAAVPFLGLLALCGCGEKEPPSEVATTIAGREGIAGSKEAIAEMARKKGVAGLKADLKSERSVVRMEAIAGLGTLKDNGEATKTLLEVANGNDLEDAYWGIIALGVQGAAEGKAALEKLAESPDAHRRAAVCLAIHEARDESLYPLLDTLVQDLDREVKGAATQMKAKIAAGGPRAE